jgi:hypothetical protein
LHGLYELPTNVGECVGLLGFFSGNGWIDRRFVMQIDAFLCDVMKIAKLLDKFL